MASGGRMGSTSSVALSDEPGVNVYPNPISDKLRLDFKGRIESDVSISIVDVLGRMYFQSSGLLQRD